jgi:hypothetical protein
MAQDGGKVVSLRHRLLFTPRKYSWYSFLLEAESTPRPQCDQKDLCQWKIPMTPAGIEPTTFQFVAQHLNHCAAAVPMPRVKWSLLMQLDWCFLQCVWEVTVHLGYGRVQLKCGGTQCTGGKFRKSLYMHKRCWKWCPRASIQAWTCLILFAITVQMDSTIA